LSRASRPAPHLLLGTESLLGITRAPRDRQLQVAARFTEPESLAVTFSKALASGADGVLASPSRPLAVALAELRQSVPLYALLPNVPEYVRDASESGLRGAAAKRMDKVGLGGRLHLAWTGFTHAAGVLGSDFAALVSLLLELEAGWLKARDLRGVVVAAALTDLALAGKHRRFFTRVVKFIHGRFRATAAFETHNLGHLLAALREWEVRPDFVIGPVNPRGLMMKPTPEDVRAELSKSEIPVLAKELRAGGTVPLLEGGRYALAAGAKGLVPDLADVEDLVGELGSLTRAMAPTG
jgi:hypothetical protein